MKNNPYKILGVNPSMSLDEIKSKYRKLAKIYHPDRVNGDQDKFIEIQEAWEFLKSSGSKNFNKNMGIVTHETLFTFRRKK